MDVMLAVASKREVRDYNSRAVPADVERRILEAGRVAGSSRNTQARRFIVVADPDRREQLADAVYAPGNVRGATLMVAIVAWGRGPTAFDVGRAAQNMMLAAWEDGVGSCPNGIADPDQAARILALSEPERAVIVITFGYPAGARDPHRHSVAEWIARADRKPYDAVVQRL
ncbi:MAG: nitroreductase family protein [Solirubrobacteraceae bacterium]|jgi:nitroreductase